MRSSECEVRSCRALGSSYGSGSDRLKEALHSRALQLPTLRWQERHIWWRAALTSRSVPSKLRLTRPNFELRTSNSALLSDFVDKD